MKDRISSFVRVKASELGASSSNFRKHPKIQRDALVGVLEEIGYASALVARRGQDGELVLIDGHLRADLDPDQQVPVLVLDVSEAEADKLIASMDPIAAMARSDPAALLSLLERVDSASEGLADLFESLRRSGESDLAKLIKDPDEIPEVPEPRAKPGDLFVLGSHRLICGDATDAAVMTRLMAGEAADLFLTDPPWGVEYEGRTKRSLRIMNDSKQGLERLLAGSLSAANGVLKEGAAFYIFYPSGPLSVLFGQAVLDQGWDLRQSLIWKKDRAVIGHHDYMHEHECIMAGYTPSSRRRGRGYGGFYGGNSQSSVIQIPRPTASRDHPTSKPVQLLAHLVSNSSRKNGVVLDSFGGSGSTLLACEQLGRKARLIELDPAYVDVIITRFELLSGIRAAKEAS
jgi:DNA modification methylase